MITTDRQFTKTTYPNGYGWGTLNKDGNPVGTGLRDLTQIRAILVHTTNGNPASTFDAEAEYLRDSKDVSSHYLIGKDGHITEILPLDHIAWHSGDCLDNDYENKWSIGIEMHWTPALGVIPDTIIDSLTNLVRDLIKRFNIRKIERHRAQAIDKSGHLGRKIDPSGFSDAAFIAWRTALFSTAISKVVPYTVQVDTPIYESRNTKTIALNGTAKIAAGTRITTDDLTNGWLHIESGVGFIPLSTTTNHVCAERYDGNALILGKTNINKDIALARIKQITEADAIVHLYESVATSAGINWLLAFAQALHETGSFSSYWSQPPRRNPAGLGVTGEPGKGLVFATWEEAINAHIGHLLCYALRDSDMNEIQLALSNKSPRKHLIAAPQRGSVKRLIDLNGKWAPGNNYGQAIGSIADSMAKDDFTNKTSSTLP
jgi:hypothetical protein